MVVSGKHLLTRIIIAILLVMLFFSSAITNAKPFSNLKDEKQNNTVSLFDFAIERAMKEDSYQKSDSLIYITTKLFEVGEYKKALALAEKIPSETERLELFASVAEMLWRTQKYEEAKTLFKRIRDCKYSVPNGEKSVDVMCNAQRVTLAHTITGQYTEALQIAASEKDEMRWLGAIEYILAQYVYSEGGKIPDETLSNILERVRNFERNYKCPSKAKDDSSFDECENELNNFKDRQLTFLRLSIPLAYLKNGYLKESESLLKEAKESFGKENAEYNKSFIEFAFGKIAVAYAKLGKMEEVFRLTNSLETSAKEKVLLDVAKVFYEQGKTDLAKRALEIFRAPRKEMLVWGDVIASAASLYKKLGDAETSRRLFRIVIDTAPTIENETERRNSYIAVTKFASEAGEYELAREAVSKARKIYDFSYAWLLGFIAESAATNKHYDVMNETVNEIINVKEKKEMSDRIRLLANMTGALLKLKEKANSVLQSAIQIWQTPDENQNVVNSFYLIQALATAGLLDKAFDVALTMEGKPKAAFAKVLAYLGAEFAKQNRELNKTQQQKLRNLISEVKPSKL